MRDAFAKKFGRQDVTVDNIKALCTRNSWKTGRTGCFEKGQTPANKGMKMPFNAASARTQFKKGSRPANAKPLGHERVGKSGYIEISVAEPNPYTGAPQRYRRKHIWLWEKVHGAIPPGHCLKSIDGDRTNTDPSNWLCIPRSLLPRLSGRWSLGYDEAPAELKPAVLAAARLQHAARRARKAAQQ